MRAAQVVFVDDEPKVCQAVRKTLERAGANVSCFPSAEDCLRHLGAHRCDLLITDVRMPGTDGMDLLRQVKAQLPWIPVLIVTGYGDVPLAVQALKNGAVDFIEKPLDRDVFLQTVQRLIEQKGRPAAVLAESLTRTERTILYLILDGRNNREIADDLHRSPRTIEVHRSHLMQKLDVTNVSELLRRAAQMGLLQSSRARDEGTAIPRGPAAVSDEENLP
jgi:two-component system response regulator FixJ